jgi:hypothetical protein
MEAIPHLQSGRLRASPFQNRRFSTGQDTPIRINRRDQIGRFRSDRAGTLRQVARRTTSLNRTPRSPRSERTWLRSAVKRSRAPDLRVSSSPRGRGVIRL